MAECAEAHGSNSKSASRWKTNIENMLKEEAAAEAAAALAAMAHPPGQPPLVPPAPSAPPSPPEVALLDDGFSVADISAALAASAASDDAADAALIGEVRQQSAASFTERMLSLQAQGVPTESQLTTLLAESAPEPEVTLVGGDDLVLEPDEYLQPEPPRRVPDVRIFRVAATEYPPRQI